MRYVCSSMNLHTKNSEFLVKIEDICVVFIIANKMARTTFLVNFKVTVESRTQIIN